MRRRLWLRLLLVALALPLWAASVSAQSSAPRVMASFSILADIARQVAGDAATVDTLIPIGANPHSYEASAQDVARLSDADAVLVVGVNYEESLLPVVEEAAGDRMIVASECVPVRPVTLDEVSSPDSGALIPAEPPCDAALAEVSAAFGADYGAREGEHLGYVYQGICAAPPGSAERADAHAVGSCDPHVWTDPRNAALWALRIRDALSGLNPASAEEYAQNAAAYLDQLVALDRELQGVIGAIPEARRVLVTNHLALGYFSARYGLRLAGVVLPGGSTTSEPSVQEVLRLVETIRAAGAPAIFTESTVSDRLAAQVAGEAGVTLVPLYTGSLGEPAGPAATYLDYMRFNAQTIAAALQ